MWQNADTPTIILQGVIAILIALISAGGTLALKSRNSKADAAETVAEAAGHLILSYVNRLTELENLVKQLRTDLNQSREKERTLQNEVRELRRQLNQLRGTSA